MSFLAIAKNPEIGIKVTWIHRLHFVRLGMTIMCHPEELAPKDPGHLVYHSERGPKFTQLRGESRTINKQFYKKIAGMDKKGFVYILASQKNGTLYVGVTSNLERRIFEHKSELIDGFTKKYHVHNLVRYQEFSTITESIEREKHLKGISRKKKLAIIEENNPLWNDLSESL